MATTHRLHNGVDVEQLQGMAEAIRAEPEAGIVTIRTRHRWDDGFAVDGSTEELENAGEVTARRFTFRTDWSPEAGGRDSGPTPGELVLAAFGACLASTYATQAATRGVDIDELEVTLETEVDLRGQLELAPVRPGLGGLKATVAVRSESGDAALKALGQAVGRTSPVYDTLANPVPIELSVIPWEEAGNHDSRLTRRHQLGRRRSLARRRVRDRPGLVLADGVVLGLVLGVGFGATFSSWPPVFARMPWAWWLVNNGAFLLMLIVMGAILGAWR